MDEIEATIHLPPQARPLREYARYYAYASSREVVGAYMLPQLDGRPGQSCEEIGPSLKSKMVPCSLPRQEGKEVGANQRAWVSAYYKLPMGDDGKCGAVDFDFDVTAHRFNYVTCGGIEPNIRPDPDQVRFFEKPKALAAAVASKTPLPIAVLLEDGALTLALYDDGTVFKREGDGLVRSKLTGDDREQLVRSLDVEALRPSYGEFRVAAATDQGTQDLLFFTDSRPVFVSVYGRLNDPLVRASVPSAVVATYDAMKRFNPTKAHLWSGTRVPHDNLWRASNDKAN